MDAMTTPIPTVYPPCRDCKEPDSASSPDGRCRDCDIEHIQSRGACRECLVGMIRPEIYTPPVPIRDQHKPGCSLKDAEVYYPRNEAEYLQVRKAIMGWAPAPEECPCGYTSDTTPGCGGDQCDHKKEPPP